MGKSIKFNVSEVINLAMRTFWQKGFKATLKDLEKATGLNRSSLYNTFGDKDEIFSLTMKCYLDYVDEWISASVSNQSFQEFLQGVITSAATDNFEDKGCYFLNSFINKKLASVKIQKVLDAAYIRVISIFENRILLAKQNHELDVNVDTTALATLILATIAGLRAFNQSGLPKEDLQNAANIALQQFS